MEETPEFDQADLPPVEYLIMEVLGSRHRLGEDHWTFPSKLNSWLNSLARKGLLNWQAGVMEHTSRAWLTEAGQGCCLSEEYLLGRKWEAPTTGDLHHVGVRLRDQYGEMQLCAAPDCDKRFIPQANNKEFCTEKCRQRISERVHRDPFTPEMEAQLLADAKAGNIKAWHQ